MNDEAGIRSSIKLNVEWRNPKVRQSKRAVFICVTFVVRQATE